MAALMLLKAGIKRQAAVIAGVFVLMTAASTALGIAVSVLVNAQDYASEQMDRLGFGDVTVWASGMPDAEALAASVAETPGVRSAQAQPLVFAGYAANGHHSDDEGQLIAYDGERYPYTFLDEGLNTHAQPPVIEPGTVYVSPALTESFDVQVGDALTFELARTGLSYTLTVAGYFEDPFMGSSMIDMKSFLVSAEDFADVVSRVEGTSTFDVLGRVGAMIHVEQQGSAQTPLEFDRLLAQNAELAPYAEFSYSHDALLRLMLLQQTVLAGFLVFFALALVVVALIVLGHAVSSAIETERRDIAALKTVGCTSKTLRRVQTAQYAVGALVGMAAGTVLGALASGAASGLLVSSAGLLAPSDLRLEWCLAAYAVIVLVLAGVVALKTRGIASIPPVEALGSGAAPASRTPRTPLASRALPLSLAVRSIASNKARYVATFAVAALLVLFVSAVGRMNAWVGPNGEGLMDAFSAADHDVGVQPLGPTNMQGVEETIGRFDRIVGVYSLTMQPVCVDGAAYTANVIDAPERFHILEGRTSEAADEIVLTPAVAAELGKGIGDTVQVADAASTQSYEVVGIYQCANEMGANVGMSLEGYSRIGDVRGYIWCYHYLLADGSHNNDVAAALQESYGAAAAVHTNSWSGLAGLVSTMRIVLVALFGVAALLVAVSTALSSGALLLAERRDMAVCKGLGFTSRQLRASFALRLAVVTGAGALVGLAASALFADVAIAQLMSAFGIGAFESHLGLANSVLPAADIVALAAAFAYLFSRRIKRAEPVELFSGFDE